MTLHRHRRPGRTAGPRPHRIAALAALVATLLTACATPYTPRPAEVAAPAEVRLALFGSGAAIAMASATIDRDLDGQQESRRGNAPSPFLPGSRSTLLRAFSLEAHAAFGVVPPCEAGPILGTSRIGAEMRCQLLHEDRAPVSLTLAAAGGTGILLDRGGPWARAGADISRRTGAFIPSLNPALSWGTENHLLRLDLPPEYDGSARNPNLVASARLVRRELRVVPAAGLTWVPRRVERMSLQHGLILEDIGLRIHVGLVPWITVASSDSGRLTCTWCQDVEVLDMDLRWGALLVLGVSTRPVSLRR
ncbi:MAG: hypothetical protein EA398_14430 [Deltaproteobacteria bacterium]|nr:MAG: hypothetical protein EA398_14430 [Deltaproteobacteria bacterium]